MWRLVFWTRLTCDYLGLSLSLLITFLDYDLQYSCSSLGISLILSYIIHIKWQIYACGHCSKAITNGNSCIDMLHLPYFYSDVHSFWRERSLKKKANFDKNGHFWCEVKGQNIILLLACRYFYIHITDVNELMSSKTIPQKRQIEREIEKKNWTTQYHSIKNNSYYKYRHASKLLWMHFGESYTCTGVR